MEATQPATLAPEKEEYRVVLIPKDMLDFIKEKLGQYQSPQHAPVAQFTVVPNPAPRMSR